MDISNFWWSSGSGGGGGYQIQNSLRFRGGQLLARLCAATPANIYESTVSFWMKKTKPVLGESPTEIDYLMDGYFSADNQTVLFLNSDYGPYGNTDSARCVSVRSGTQIGGVPGSAPLRDPNAWYHVLYLFQTGVSTGTCTVFINGVQVDTLTVNSTNGYPFFPWWNGTPSGGGVAIGRSYGTAAQYFDGYLAEFHMVPAIRQPTDFGEFNNQGVWVPKKYTGGGYGINGFYLDFSDPNDIGADRSNSTTGYRSFTPTGFELGNDQLSTYDHFSDTPTNNFGVFNPLLAADPYNGCSDANMVFGPGVGGTNVWIQNPIPIKLTGKKYIQFYTASYGADGYRIPGITAINRTTSAGYPGDAGDFGVGYYSLDGNFYVNGVSVAVATSWGDFDYVGVAFDADTLTVEFFLNGVSQGTQVVPAGDYYFSYGVKAAGGLLNNLARATWTAGGAIPAGYEPLSTDGLPAAPIPNGRDHFQAITGPGSGAGTGGRQGNWINDLFSAPPGDRDQAHASTADVFQSAAPKTLAFDGNTGTVAETDQSQGRPGWMSFRPSDTTVPELTASSTFKIKVRRIQELWVNGTQMTGDFTTNTGSLFDLSSQLTFPFTLESFEIGGISGQDAGLFGIELDGELLTQNGILETAQTTFPNGLWWIKDRVNSNDWQFVDSVRGGNLAMQSNRATAELAYDPPDGDSVAWCWNAGGAAVTNNDGSIESQVSANADAGFSIVTYTGNGGNAAATIGHGLGRPPEFMILNFVDTGANRSVYHTSIGNQRRLILNSDLAQSDPAVGLWNNTNPGDQVFSVGASFNQSTVFDYCVYCFAPVPGYSAFGIYTGNGDADGPFIYTGFSVSLLLVKAVNLSENWMIWDSTRSPSNPTGSAFHPNLTNAEFAGDNYDIDLLSNGFKPRQPSGEMNSASSSYIYAAFAENPFGANNTSPATAR